LVLTVGAGLLSRRLVVFDQPDCAIPGIFFVQVLATFAVNFLQLAHDVNSFGSHYLLLTFQNLVCSNQFVNRNIAIDRIIFILYKSSHEYETKQEDGQLHP
jgi:hypothetical protein